MHPVLQHLCLFCQTLALRDLNPQACCLLLYLAHQTSRTQAELLSLHLTRVPSKQVLELVGRGMPCSLADTVEVLLWSRCTVLGAVL